MVVIATSFGDVHIFWLAAAFRPIIIVINVLLYRLDSDRDRARLHQRLHVPHHDVFVRPQVPELAIDDTAVVRRPHALCVSLLRINNESAGPEMHIVQNGSGFDKTAPVHIFKDADAVHGDHGAETESDQRDRPPLNYVRFEKEDG